MAGNDNKMCSFCGGTGEANMVLNGRTIVLCRMCTEEVSVAINNRMLWIKNKRTGTGVFSVELINGHHVDVDSNEFKASELAELLPQNTFLF